jgi:hypothetical protein
VIPMTILGLLRRWWTELSVSRLPRGDPGEEHAAIGGLIGSHRFRRASRGPSSYAAGAPMGMGTTRTGTGSSTGPVTWGHANKGIG